MKTQSYEIGMVGLGVMGRNLLLNMADHGPSVAGYDKDATKVAALRLEAENRDIRGAADIDEILDVAKQKGTGMWTSESAMELQVPIPTIDLAVRDPYL